MLVRLYKCDGCWRVTDNYATEDGSWVGCKCGRNRIWTARPTKMNLLKWVLTDIKHFFGLLKKDYGERK